MLSASQSGPAEVDEVSPVELKIVLGSALFLFVVVINFIFNFQLIMKFPAHGRPLLFKAKEDVTAKYVRGS